MTRTCFPCHTVTRTTSVRARRSVLFDYLFSLGRETVSWERRIAVDPQKRGRLEAAGWRVGSAQEFLGLSGGEAAHVEMNFWKEGDRSEAICPGCERRVETRFEVRSVHLEQSGVSVPDVLVGVCTECDRTVSIPAQSTPKIAGRGNSGPFG
jgi:hypothetical protein